MQTQWKNKAYLILSEFIVKYVVIPLLTTERRRRVYFAKDSMVVFQNMTHASTQQ